LPLKSLVSALGVILALLVLGAVPAVSVAAETITVTTTEDGDSAAGLCEGTNPCTLRKAMELAGETTGDTISFAGLPAGEVLEIEEVALPEIDSQVTIDGDTAVGATPGVPAIELEPVDFDEVEGVAGLSVRSGVGTRIEGLAIGGFGVGIEVGLTEGPAPDETEICGDYLGVALDGITQKPNQIGVEVFSFGEEEKPEATEIGGRGCAQNVIGGNTEYGVYDAGLDTSIAGDLIGFGPGDGEKLPNGTKDGPGAGVYESAEGSGATIGGPAGAVGEGNDISFNHGPGAFVATTASEVSIRHNSFSGNEGLGIEIPDGDPPPTITSAKSPGPGKLDLTGTVNGAAEVEEVEVEFFGSPTCDASGAGEGQTYLGSETIEVTAAGPNAYTFRLFTEPPADDTVITATSTRQAGATTQFSTCAAYVPPPGPQTFTVTTTEDLSGGGCTVVVCSLREAIKAADETDAEDTIKFAAGAEGPIRLTEDLPEITEPVEIDGTSALGYAGRPLMLIDGTDVPRGGEVQLSEGLAVRGEGGGSVIKGLAIGGFEYGVWLDGGAGSRLCSSWIGVELGGTTALPNEIGVEAGEATDGDGEDSAENEIGVGCGSAAPNVIAGNLHWGVVDLGAVTRIGSNVIGVGPDGAPMPNGEVGESGGEGGPVGGGIKVELAADQPVIGGLGTGNEIADNHGPGVVVASGVSQAKIRGNSIFANDGPGIQIDETAPEVPTIESVATGPGTAAFTGEAIAGDGPESIELDFFASEACGSGEGRTYLGSATVANTTGGGASYATGPIAASIPAGQDFITATATGSELGQTSEFSGCFEYEPPPPVAIVTAPPASTEASAGTFEFAAVGGSTYECSLDGAAFGPCTSPASFGGLAVGPHTFAVRAVTAAGSVGQPTRYEWTVAGPPPAQKSSSVAQDLPAGNPPPGPEPTNGEKVVVAPVSGKVRIKLPGTNKYVPLQELKEIPVGAVIDATKGRVKLTSRNPDGTEQTAEFFEGVFRVKQRTGTGLVVLELLDTRTCPAPGATGRATASSLALRPAGAGTAGKLWGSGHGNFRTEGNDGSATVRGTIWLVEDRCNGTTFFKTRRDVVTVRDFITGKTFSLREGRTYLAGP
jgi:CSLREA domain-containing protein